MARPTVRPWSAIFLLLAGADLARAVKWTPEIARFEEAIGKRLCPSSCSEDGASPKEWTRFQNMDDLILCEDQVKLVKFPLHTESLMPSSASSIRACSTSANQEQTSKKAARDVSGLKSGQLGFRIAGQVDHSASVDEAVAAIDALLKAIENGQDISSNLFSSTILSAQAGSTVAGVYLGARLDKQSTAAEVLGKAKNYIKNSGAVKTLVGQSCGSKAPADYIAGVVVDSTGSSALEGARSKLSEWNEARCIPDATANRKFSAAGSLSSDEGESSSVWVTKDNYDILDEIINGHSTLNTTASTNSTAPDKKRHVREFQLHARGDCRIERVDSGDTCESMAAKCRIKPHEFTEYNQYDKNLCSTLRPGQPVCCSRGDLPDIRPKPNGDKCATHPVDLGESCSSIAASNGLTIEELEKFNKGKIWGFQGCKNLFAHTVLCVSSGNPPLPAPEKGAVCGPQKPNGDPIKGDVTVENMAKMNPCPLNACCNIWGQCGTLADFCTITGDKPGEVKPGTNGCISNCGTEIVNNGSPPSEFIKIAYFEGWNRKRNCLHMNVDSVDRNRFTHIHFSFIDISPSYEIYVSDEIKAEFERFKTMGGIKRIIAFGGWTASTHPSTYWIFREGVKAANRATLANNIIKFLNEHGLDGVDMDWEYPAAPDLPDIPTGDPVNGSDYLQFLVYMKRRLKSNQSLSIAAPASFWYLKGFPIEQISRIVNYIVYMTYDLHGQWDAGNPWASPGCGGGNCLRSHVNMTETMNALVMITKAGVPTNKIIVGVSSYGRSFRMADPGCTGVNCKFTGDAKHSQAEKGWCTDTAGYVSDAEIAAIKAGNGFNNVKHWTDTESDSQMMVWNGNWVAYMDRGNKDRREGKYRGLNFGGTTDWAVDLESFSPFDKGHPGIFWEKPTPGGGENPVPKMCDPDSWGEEGTRYMNNELSKFLWQKLKSEGAGKWADKRWKQGKGDGDGEGGQPGGSGCGDLNGGQCQWGETCKSSYALNYWTMKKAGHFLSVVRLLKSSTTAAWFNGSYYNEEVKKALPLNGREEEKPDGLLSFLSNFGNSFGVLGSAIGNSNPISGAVLGTASAVLSLTKDNIPEKEQEFAEVEKALNTIWNSYTSSLEQIPQDMFVNGGLQKWPLGAFQDVPDYPIVKMHPDFNQLINRIVNFFHGRFLEYTDLKQEDRNKAMDRSFKQFITNAALGEGNYYVMKGAYYEKDCTKQNSGRWRDGHCYTLEHQNGGWDGWSSRNHRNRYSTPVNDDKLKFLEDKAEIDWDRFYPTVEACQRAGNGYFGDATMDLDRAMEPNEGYTDCAFNLPIFTVKPMDLNYKGPYADEVSPCCCIFGGKDDPKTAGVNFLPDKIGKWFDSQVYCSTLAPAMRIGTWPEENTTDVNPV